MTTVDVRIWRGQEIAFGNFRFYPEQRLLLSGNIPVSLGSRAREILVLLAERAGEVVEKRDLMARVWPDVFVEEGTLRVHIAAIRKALGDGRDGLRYIENVTGRGYRLIAPVRRLGAPHPSLLDADPEVSVEPISTRSRYPLTN